MSFDQNDWAPAAASASDLAEVKTTAKSKVKTYAQDSAPTAEAVGDLWMDTDNGDALYRWDGKDWVNVQDGSIAEAKATARTAQESADTKTRTTYGTTWPTTARAGDIHIDTVTAKVYRAKESY